MEEEDTYHCVNVTDEIDVAVDVFVVMLTEVTVLVCVTVTDGYSSVV